MNRDADTCSNSTYITRSKRQLPTDREGKTGREKFKKTDAMSLEITRCQEEGHRFKSGDGRDVHRLSEGQGD